MNRTEMPSKSVRFGVYEVDLRSSELRRQGRKIKLQEQPCRILAILLEQRGEVVTREELRKRLWSDDTFVDFDHSLNTAIMRLREALGDSSDNPLFIETLPRHGYRFIAPVEEVTAPEQEKHPEGATAAASESQLPVEESVQVSPSLREPARQQPKGRQIGLRWALVLGGLLTLCVLTLVGLMLRPMRNGKGASLQPNQIKSVVVLPFENLSGDKDQQYFTEIGRAHV